MEISITNSGTIGCGIYATPSGGNSLSGVTFRLVGPLDHFVVLIKCPSNLHCLPSLPAVLWVIKDQIIFCYVSSQHRGYSRHIEQSLCEYVWGGFCSYAFSNLVLDWTAVSQPPYSVAGPYNVNILLLCLGIRTRDNQEWPS